MSTVCSACGARTDAKPICEGCAAIRRHRAMEELEELGARYERNVVSVILGEPAVPPVDMKEEYTHE
jgi:hypothetical protein